MVDHHFPKLHVKLVLSTASSVDIHQQMVTASIERMRRLMISTLPLPPSHVFVLWLSVTWNSIPGPPFFCVQCWKTGRSLGTRLICTCTLEFMHLVNEFHYEFTPNNYEWSIYNTTTMLLYVFIFVGVTTSSGFTHTCLFILLTMSRVYTCTWLYRGVFILLTVYIIEFACCWFLGDHCQVASWHGLDTLLTHVWVWCDTLTLTTIHTHTHTHTHTHRYLRQRRRGPTSNLLKR